MTGPASRRTQQHRSEPNVPQDPRYRGRHIGSRVTPEPHATIGAPDPLRAPTSRTDTGLATCAGSELTFTPHHPLLARALAYIHEHYREPQLTADTLAHALGTSRRHLDRVFRGSLPTPTQLIAQRRTSSALTLMHTQLTADWPAVAQASGFTSVRTLERHFKKYLGESPACVLERLRHAAQASRASGAPGTAIGASPRPGAPLSSGVRRRPASRPPQSIPPLMNGS
ncbi:AraC family transcriptional regulator [Microbacterium sp. NPDC096154]|uniref:AraC family transcriptional regulator n=1 Tax=Microbacterium sp. NPDC096154 TaxID=3155549 RepID=UPI00331D3B3D